MALARIAECHQHNCQNPIYRNVLIHVTYSNVYIGVYWIAFCVVVLVGTVLPIWTYEGLVFAEVYPCVVERICFLQELPPRDMEALSYCDLQLMLSISTVTLVPACKCTG